MDEKNKKTILKHLKMLLKSLQEKVINVKIAKKTLVIVIIMLLLSMYLGGLMGILINPYRYGGSMGLLHALWVVTQFEVARFASLMFALMLTALAFWLHYKTKPSTHHDGRGFQFAKGGVYGSSHFATMKEYAKYLDVVDNAVETDGIIIGKTLDGKHVVSIPKYSPYNRNIAICGSQGTNKSIAFVRNMIIQCAVRNESIVVTDPKSELFEDTAHYLKKAGYEVYQWNLINQENSNGWDVLAEIEGTNEIEYVDVLCNTIIKNTAGANEGDFFDKIETVLLKALILYVIYECPKDKRTLGTVYNMLLQESAESLDRKFEELPVNHPAYGPYNLFSKNPLNKANAILGLGSRLNIFANTSVQQMTGAKEIDIESIAKRKTAVFCIASDSNTTYSMLNALFISMLFIKLMAYADSTPSRKCDIPVHIILDEFSNVGVIEEFKQKEATARSRDIGIDIIFQNLPQLQNRYPDGVWEELIGGCDFRILLGCNDETTAKYYSQLIGTATVEVSTVRKSNDIFDLNEQHSQGLGKRELYLPEEILRMDDDELLLFVRGCPPIKLKKFKYYEHPEALKLHLIKTTEIIPNWRTDISDYKKKESSLNELIKKVELDDERLVVKDTSKWGNQREALLQSLERMKSKYEKVGYFPNGQSIFDKDGAAENNEPDIADVSELSIEGVEEKNFDRDGVGIDDSVMLLLDDSEVNKNGEKPDHQEYLITTNEDYSTSDKKVTGLNIDGLF